MAGTFFEGDNIDVLRYWIDDASVDLVYLDPPFNAQRDFNLPFGAEDARPEHVRRAFKDTWTWDEQANRTYDELTRLNVENLPEKLPGIVRSLYDFLYPKYKHALLAYLVNMAIRLVELHRVMKNTASLYLHCDPRASHYLKMILDAIFGVENFRNEIIWKCTGAHNSADAFGWIHDVLLYYVRSDAAPFVPVMEKHSAQYLKKFSKTDPVTGKKFREAPLTGDGIVKEGDSAKPWRGHNPTEDGRHWQPPGYLYTKYREITGEDLAQYPFLQRLDKLDEAGMIYFPKKSKVKGKAVQPAYKWFLEDALKQGNRVHDIWSDIPPINSQDKKEDTGYPTQKPLDLLKRVLAASSRPGQIVLDPFCGCGTTIVACEQMEREWLGIDIGEEAIRVLREVRIPREAPGASFNQVIEPFDVKSAERLAALKDGKYEFQWWAVRKIGGRDIDGIRKKGPDRGKDGEIFIEEPDGTKRRVLISVKSGVNPVPAWVDELHSNVTNATNKAYMGILICLHEPTPGMRAKAREHQMVRTQVKDQRDPWKIQVISAADLFRDGFGIELPGDNVTPKQARPTLQPRVNTKGQMGFAFAEGPPAKRPKTDKLATAKPASEKPRAPLAKPKTVPPRK